MWREINEKKCPVFASSCMWYLYQTKMIFKESWPKKINVCYMGDLYTWQIHTNYITTLFWWFFFMKVLGKLKMWILALNVELKMQFSLKYVVCRMYRWKWPEKMLIQREKMGASWFESSVRISANYNESRYKRPYVTRKYWDGMIEGTIVGIGKDGAK